MEIPSKMTIALTLTSTPPQSSPLTSPVRHEIFPISQYPAEKLDPALETQVLSSYALWLQQEIRRLQSRVEEQVEMRVQLNKRLLYVTQNFETEVRRGVVEELSKEYRKSAIGESRNKTSTFSGFDCIGLSTDADFMNGNNGSNSLSRIKKKSDSCSFLYEDLYEKKRGCLTNYNGNNSNGTPASTLSSSSASCYSTPNSPASIRNRRALRSSYSHPHRVRFSQHDTVVLFQPDNEDRNKPLSSSSGDEYRLDAFSMSDDDDVIVNHDNIGSEVGYSSLVGGELQSSSSSGEIIPPYVSAPVRSSSLIIGQEVEPDREQARHTPSTVAEPVPHYFTLEELTAIAKREGLI